MTVQAARIYVWAATTCVAFAVWGSLFPFDYRPVSFAEAIDWFLVLGGPRQAELSLSDAFSNFLLFVPVGLFVAASLERRWTPRHSAALVIAGGTLLSIAVEFAQAFVLWRTPSTIDVVAEAAGTIAGLAAWRMAAADLDAAARSATEAWHRASAGERLLLVYCGLFAFAWLLPLDFTLRPNEIADKYLHKRLLLPFVPSPDAATVTELQLLTAAAVPLGWAGAICGCSPDSLRSPARACHIAMFALITLALAQVAVFSRTTDFTTLLAALPGVVMGVAGACLAHRPTEHIGAPTPRPEGP
ncbi:MAG: VanZ family protein [Vicinamibacterales bacterium]|jgi:VanZ family protein